MIIRNALIHSEVTEVAEEKRREQREKAAHRPLAIFASLCEVQASPHILLLGGPTGVVVFVWFGLVLSRFGFEF